MKELNRKFIYLLLDLVKDFDFFFIGEFVFLYYFVLDSEEVVVINVLFFIVGVLIKNLIIMN